MFSVELLVANVLFEDLDIIHNYFSQKEESVMDFVSRLVRDEEDLTSPPVPLSLLECPAYRLQYLTDCAELRMNGLLSQKAVGELREQLYGGSDESDPPSEWIVARNSVMRSAFTLYWVYRSAFDPVHSSFLPHHVWSLLKRYENVFSIGCKADDAELPMRGVQDPFEAKTDLTYESVALFVMWALGCEEAPQDGNGELREVARGLVDEVAIPSRLVLRAKSAVTTLEMSDETE